MVRYFIGDVIEIVSFRNEELNVNIPQMMFHSRMDGVIDFAGFIRLSESTIWQAIENSGVSYKEWTVRKEEGANPKVHLYLEIQPGAEARNGKIVGAIHEQLKKLDTYYAAHVDLLDRVPLEVTLLPQGAFKSYAARQRAAGADLAHLKPPHMNPSDDVIDRLLSPVP